MENYWRGGGELHFNLVWKKIKIKLLLSYWIKNFQRSNKTNKWIWIEKTFKNKKLYIELINCNNN